MRPACMVHTFLSMPCVDCRRAIAWQSLMTGNTFTLQLRSIGRQVLLDSESVIPTFDGDAWESVRIGQWVAHVK